MWWALIRFAMRFVFVYGPDLLTAWTVHQNQSGTPAAGEGTGPAGPARSACSRRSPPGPTTASRSARTADRTDHSYTLRLDHAVRVRRTHHRRPPVPPHRRGNARRRAYHPGPVRSGPRRPLPRRLPPPLGRSSRHDQPGTLVARLRDACYILICAFGALRDSETQGLRRGCVVIADGGYALSGEITKGKDTPARALWWIDPLVARAVTILEGLSDAVPVTDVVGGHLVPSDRLLWTTQAARFGGAGVGQGAELLRRCIAWINENAALFDLPRADDAPGQPAIPLVVTPRQLRVTFAAVAAIPPTGRSASPRSCTTRSASPAPTWPTGTPHGSTCTARTLTGSPSAGCAAT